MSEYVGHVVLEVLMQPVQGCWAKWFCSKDLLVTNILSVYCVLLLLRVLNVEGIK